MITWCDQKLQNRFLYQYLLQDCWVRLRYAVYSLVLYAFWYILYIYIYSRFNFTRHNTFQTSLRHFRFFENSPDLHKSWVPAAPATIIKCCSHVRPSIIKHQHLNAQLVLVLQYGNIVFVVVALVSVSASHWRWHSVCSPAKSSLTWLFLEMGCVQHQATGYYTLCFSDVGGRGRVFIYSPFWFFLWFDPNTNSYSIF